MVALAAAVTAAVLTGAMPSGPPRVVVGGIPADTATYPWAVALSSRAEYGSARSGQFCGGTLIAPTKVLTAAHCMYDANGKRDDRPDLKVIQGRTDLRSTKGREVVVGKVYVNPDFDPGRILGDWAVLTLHEPLDSGVASMVEQGADVYASGSASTVIGWGDTTGLGDYSSTLRQVTVPLVSDAACGTAYPGGRFGTYDATAMVCAGERQGGKDACSADSGGPLLVGGRVAGIVSWGDGCALPGKPGVYTRVATFARDIRDAAGL
ncbi:S1 family peptidase [Embleya scabrispora]|uniref:S1 family peptidase n=1 Tax=Embleya scabrispora TaxID=159449 RepID=UPI00035F155D|nr:serine protease [Embleya scabrispora]MYS87998.1 trypsin-like serine protease [Streptomyces sp. SID5474]